MMQLISSHHTTLPAINMDPFKRKMVQTSTPAKNRFHVNGWEGNLTLLWLESREAPTEARLEKHSEPLRLYLMKFVVRQLIELAHGILWPNGFRKPTEMGVVSAWVRLSTTAKRASQRTLSPN